MMDCRRSTQLHGDEGPCVLEQQCVVMEMGGCSLLGPVVVHRCGNRDRQAHATEISVRR